MAETRRYNIPPHQHLELEQILEEAKHRWLRPSEILQILTNYQRFHLTPEPPLRPSPGSLFLFDRKAIRYFRKDGHRWRKKRDGKTVREAHEKLKAGSVDVLHCYYAHGEDNDNFQRRCYWMLDGNLEHIVLVHYREVKEGHKSGVSHSLADPSSLVESSQLSSAPLPPTPSRAYTAQTSHASTPTRINWSGQTTSPEIENVHARDGLGTSSLAQPTFDRISHSASQLATQVEGFPLLSRNPPGSWFAGAKFDHGSASSMWSDMCSSNKSLLGKFSVEQPNGADFITNRLVDARLDSGNVVLDTVASQDGQISNVDAQTASASPQRVIQEHDFNLVPPQSQNSSFAKIEITTIQFENKPKVGDADKNESGELKKLDSFGRWMDKEIGRDCGESLMASDSANYWNTLGAENDDKEVSSLSRHMQLDIDSLGPSLSQEQLFSIHDYSPDWTYSGVETKVIIIGTFLGSKELYGERKWGCMFGEIEVSAEVLTDSVIRCWAPPHASGRVPFYVTCRNRLACSEVREFDYRENPPGTASVSSKSACEEEVCFQIRLARLLSLDQEKKWLNCLDDGCDRCKVINILSTMINIEKNDEGLIRKKYSVSEGDSCNFKEKLIESLLRDRLYEWLVCRVHEGGKGPDILDNEGLGALHLAAGLGYNWAVGLIIAASGNPNFRDAQGRTALHWASYFGREETVVTLVRLGVDPTAVDDPTSAFPGGRSAADLASRCGHKGIAAYLAEAFLTRQLLSLNIKQEGMDSIAVTTEAEKASELAAQVSDPSSGEADEQLAIKGSLAAVRKSAHAAALILEAYRANSFHQRQLSKSGDDTDEASLDLVALGSLNRIQNRSHFEDYLHMAALRIQRKYRGWKDRREFLRIRNRIVKIQAYIRGHQARKQYKKFVWSVGIVEKVILRWRRKRTGLRGFRPGEAVGVMKLETEKADEYEFLRISRKQKFDGVEKALTRVQSMVRHVEARDQYMRLKKADEGSSSQQGQR